MKKVLAATAATLLAVGIGAAVAPAQAATTTTTTKAAASAKTPEYTPPAIKWGACTSPTLVRFGAQCGFLVVPIDYAKPTGAKIKLAVSRILHKPGTKYQGVMLTNPGGPGGSGLVLSILQGFVPNGGGEGYDWIGFDPRGVGSSVPSLSCDPSYPAAPRQPYRPGTNKILQYWLNKSAKYANACLDNPAISVALFKHVKTTDNVADMESIRKALGQQQINYYGFSYGTYLGEVYATQHPDRVRRFVFDGVIGPKDSFYQSNLNQDVAFQKTFDIYFQWLAKYHEQYNVGDTYTQVRDKFLKTQAALDKKPADGKLGGDELIDVFTSAGYYVFDWQAIAEAYSAYLNDGDASGLIQMYTDANDTSTGGDNGFALYLGTECTDGQWPTSLQKVLDDNARYDKTKASYFAWPNGWFNGPCNYWPFKASTPVNVTGANVKSKLLFVEETFDAATPYPGALQARKLFPTASMIEGQGGSTHAGSLNGVSCTDNTISRYLLTGETPKRLAGDQSDVQCPPIPQPDPTASSPAARAKVATTNAKMAEGLNAIRSTLAAAQRH